MADYSSPPRDLAPRSIVWAYLRDSGGPAQENSVTQQEAEIRAYCVRYGLALVEIFRDVAKSGGSVIGRDGFERMIDTSENENLRPRGLLIWNLARFARDLNHSMHYKSLLRMRGIIVHSITDDIPDDHIGELVEGVTDWMNEEKRRQTSRDVKRGLKSLVSQGYSPGVPPRGYVAVKVTIGQKRDGVPRIVSKWEPDPVLSEYVKIAWQLRAQGKSYPEITVATNGKLYTSGNSWVSFFRNKAYLGIGVCGDTEYPDHHEPLITQELFDAVQTWRVGHPRYGKKGHLNHPRRVGTPTLLSGFTYCIECDAMMTHSTGNRKHIWLHYICGQKDRHGVKVCSSRRVGAINAENKIMSVVLNQILTPAYLWEVIAETKKQLDSTVEIERQIKAENRRLDDLDIAIQRTLNTIEKTGSQAAQDRLAQREAEKAQAKQEIERLSLQLATAQTEITPEASDIVLIAWRDQLNKLQESGNVRDIKAWLLQFVSRIELGYNTAKIFYTYPMTDLLNTRSSLLPRGGTSETPINGVFFVYDPRPH